MEALVSRKIAKFTNVPDELFAIVVAQNSYRSSRYVAEMEIAEVEVAEGAKGVIHKSSRYLGVLHWKMSVSGSVFESNPENSSQTIGDGVQGDILPRIASNIRVRNVSTFASIWTSSNSI